MQLHRQAEFARPVEHARHLRRREGNALAEPVNRIGQTFGMGSVHARQHHLIDIGVFAPAIFGWNRMGGEIARPDPHGPQISQTARGAQHLQLVLDGQPIAGFDLHRRNAFGKKRIEPLQRVFDQRIFIHAARCGNSRNNAAAGPRHFLVARAFKPHLEFPCAIAAKNQMRVTVHQRRRREPTAKVGSFPVGKRVRNGAQHARPDDFAIFNGDAGILNEPVGHSALTHACQPDTADDTLLHDRKFPPPPLRDIFAGHIA